MDFEDLLNAVYIVLIYIVLFIVIKIFISFALITFSTSFPTFFYLLNIIIYNNN